MLCALSFFRYIDDRIRFPEAQDRVKLLNKHALDNVQGGRCARVGWCAKRDCGKCKCFLFTLHHFAIFYHSEVTSHRIKIHPKTALGKTFNIFQQVLFLLFLIVYQKVHLRTENYDAADQACRQLEDWTHHLSLSFGMRDQCLFMLIHVLMLPLENDYLKHLETTVFFF